MESVYPLHIIGSISNHSEVQLLIRIIWNLPWKITLDHWLKTGQLNKKHLQTLSLVKQSSLYWENHTQSFRFSNYMIFRSATMNPSVTRFVALFSGLLLCKEGEWEKWRERAKVKVLALHVVNWVLWPALHMAPWVPPGVIPEYRVSNKLWTLPGVVKTKKFNKQKESVSDDLGGTWTWTPILHPIATTYPCQATTSDTRKEKPWCIMIIVFYCDNGHNPFPLYSLTPYLAINFLLDNKAFL